MKISPALFEIGVPLSAEENVAKFRRCAGYAARPLPAPAQDALIAAIADLEKVDDIARLMRLSTGEVT